MEHDPGYITIYLITSDGQMIGGTRMPLRGAREIRTETNVLVGWYVEYAAIAVQRRARAVGLRFMLPDGQSVVCQLEDVGLEPTDVELGHLVRLFNLRVIHPQSRPYALGHRQ
jgi:hypothetical protein